MEMYVVMGFAQLLPASSSSVISITSREIGSFGARRGLINFFAFLSSFLLSSRSGSESSMTSSCKESTMVLNGGLFSLTDRLVYKTGCNGAL